MGALVAAIANYASGKIAKVEDEAKVQVQTGAATVDSLGQVLSNVLTETYPVVQNAGKLQRELDTLDETVNGVLAQSDRRGLDALEAKAKALFKTINLISRKLAGRLRDEDGRAEMAEIQRGIAELASAVLDPEGFMGSQRASLAAREEIAAGRNTIDRIDRLYLGILDDLHRSVANLNRVTRQQTVDGIAQSRIVIAGSVLFTLLAGFGFGLFFAHRISAPVMRLADHADAIGHGAALAPLSDAAVTSRADEFGKLSRAFNRMIEEVAAARQRLVEWSEAEIRTQYERLNAAIDNMPQGLCMFDADQKLIICNRRYAEIYSLDAEHTAPGTSLRALLEDHVAKGASPSVDKDKYIAQRIAAVSQHRPFYYVNDTRDGQVIAISYQPMPNGGSVVTHEDITERRKVEAKIAYMAHHDALTDLPNRVSLREDMETALSHVDRGAKLAVLCMDLDHFKSVNDTLGHPIGDALLQQVADRLRACVRPADIVARLGGDEFAIVQGSVDQPVGATSLAARLIKDLSEPFDLRGHQVVIGASVGIAIAPGDGSDPDRLMKNADMALYRAKEDGRGVYRFFEPDMDAKMQLRRTLELDLRRAAVMGEFELYYQPTVTLATEEINGFEALLRWHHPQRGLMLPDQFIPLTEEIGLINPIGAWVLKQACREAMNWPDHIGVAVNLSPVQFKSGTLVLDVVAALGESGLAPHRLELEITETVLLHDTEDTVGTLNQLRDLGVRIAMDDFGTGYSSLGYLRKFPFDKIKIDRSFIHDMDEKADSVAIVRAVAGLGSTLGMTTTAEGVETEAQLAKLKAEGCTEVQGFLFSEAVPAEELGTLLKSNRRAAKAVA
jgi:diguanylate cyclase (GGDEF)-like protein